MALIQWFVAVAGIGAMGTFSLWRYRVAAQRKADLMRETYEVIHPREMKHEQVVDFAVACAAHLPHPKFLRPAYAISLEKHGSSAGKRYFICIPGHVYTNIKNLLSTTVSGVSIIKVEPEDDPIANKAWDKAVEFGMHGYNVPLNIKDPDKLAARIDALFKDLHDDQEIVEQIIIIPGRHHTPRDAQEKEKLSLYTVNAIARLAAAGDKAQHNLMNLQGAFSGVSSVGSGFHKRLMPGVSDRIRRRAGTTAYPILLNERELSGFLSWIPEGGKGLPASSMISSKGIVLAGATFGGAPLALPVSALAQHQWWIGPTGSGKSALLHCQADQFARRGMGFAVIEPKGDLARDILNSIPENRVNDVVFFDPTDEANPIGLNLLAGPDPHRTTSHIVALFKKKFHDSWGPRLEMYLRIGVYTAAVNGLSILEVKELLRSPEFRRPYVRRLKDASIKRDWRDVEDGPDQAVYSVNNKIDVFSANPMIRNIVGQSGGLNMRDIILGNKILLVPLDTIAMGDTNAEIFGEMIVDQIWSAARAIPPAGRRVFPTIVDELQKFVSAVDSFEDMLAMSRSYEIPIIGAHQYTAQLDRANKGILAALKSNARTKGVFGMSPEDASKMSEYFSPLSAGELQTLPLHGVAIRMMTESGLAPTVTGTTYAPPAATGFGPMALRASRMQYGRLKAEVEAEIEGRYKDSAEERKRPSIGRVEAE